MLSSVGCQRILQGHQRDGHIFFLFQSRKIRNRQRTLVHSHCTREGAKGPWPCVRQEAVSPCHLSDRGRWNPVHVSGLEGTGRQGVVGHCYCQAIICQTPSLCHSEGRRLLSSLQRPVEPFHWARQQVCSKPSLVQSALVCSYWLT